MRDAVLLLSVLAGIPVACALAGPMGAPTSQQREWCQGINHPTPDIQIASCSAIIDAGEYLEHSFAVAFRNRGIGYLNKGQYDFAITDFDEAIRLDATNAFTYYKRGIAKRKKGDMVGGNADIAHAKKLDPHIKE